MKYKILFSKHNFFISLIYIAYKLTLNQTHRFIALLEDTYWIKKLALVAMVTSFRIRKKNEENLCHYVKQKCFFLT